jgi:hypothetical protein
LGSVVFSDIKAFKIVKKKKAPLIIIQQGFFLFLKPDAGVGGPGK